MFGRERATGRTSRAAFIIKRQKAKGTGNSPRRANESAQLSLDETAGERRPQDRAHLPAAGRQPGPPAQPEKHRPPGDVGTATPAAPDRLVRQAQGPGPLPRLPLVVRGVIP